MRQTAYFETSGGTVGGTVSGRLLTMALGRPRQLLIGLILLFSLVAFELFNFDTTRYALESLMGEVSFLGFAWATILAVAFCAIDFAGLARLFSPDQGSDTPKELWYLTGAWLLGATMNAVMTWWAVSLTLLEHDLGNEVLGREQLLSIVPIFVAALVWLTRILFIGALTVTGERLVKRQVSQRNDTQAHTLAPLRLRRNEKPSQRPTRARRANSGRRITEPSELTGRSRPDFGSMPGPEYKPAERVEALFPGALESTSQSNGLS